MLDLLLVLYRVEFERMPTMTSLALRVEAPVTRQRNSRIRFLSSSSFDQTESQTSSPVWCITLLPVRLLDILYYSWP